ncbi:hypothetical protein [Oscillatoria salina]|uniref:hypothetical protein n=1 Tax=Oscillatoria salina TaxID=331517 RepID=UPI001CC95222|nr:hypothetical protein [Oscillatoria salina]
MSGNLIKKTGHLLLTGIVISAGFWHTPGKAQTTASPNQLNAFVEALRVSAPPNRPNDGMYSQWQVLPGIIPSWTKQCVGQQMSAAQFEADSAAARRTVSCIMERELNKNLAATGNNDTAAVRRTACWWMTGTVDGCSSGATATYVQNVLNAYQQQLSRNQS